MEEVDSQRQEWKRQNHSVTEAVVEEGITEAGVEEVDSQRQEWKRESQRREWKR